jgi:epoxyqueuosine reductase QueG
VYRQTSQEVCPWNVRFARTLPEGSPFASREVIAGKDSRQLARALLGMTQVEFSAAFKNSPMKRAKLRGLKRNAAVVLGNVGTADDVGVLTRALDDEEPLPSAGSGQDVREHAAWALRLIHATSRADRYPDAGDEVGEPGVLA